jgi:hypothetical protein
MGSDEERECYAEHNTVAAEVEYGVRDEMIRGCAALLTRRRHGPIVVEGSAPDPKVENLHDDEVGSNIDGKTHDDNMSPEAISTFSQFWFESRQGYIGPTLGDGTGEAGKPSVTIR